MTSSPPPSSTPPLTGAPSSESVVLLIALGFGIAADAVTNDVGAGAGTTLAIAMLVAAVAVLHRRFGLALASPWRWVPLGSIAALATAFSWRASPDLLALVWVAIFAAYLLTALRLVGRALHDASLGELLLAAIELPVLGAVRALSAIGRQLPTRPEAVIQGPDGATSRAPAHRRDVLIGCLLAAPVLLVFTALLAAADEGFARLVGNLFDWNVAALIEHTLLISSLAVACAALTISALDAVPKQARTEQRTSWAGPAVIWIVLGSTTLLFAAFSLLQAAYLFGGADYLERTAHLTAADYARRGFFELVAVAALVVPLLLVLRRWHAPSATRAFRITAPALATLTIVLLASAAARLWIYQDRFGLSELRIYVAATLAWLALCLAWLGARASMDRAPRLATFATSSGITLVVALLLANPNALVARANMTRSVDASTDVKYLMQLGPDAVPTIVEHIDRLRPSERRFVARRLLAAEPYTRGGWRSANAARHAADSAIDEHRSKLQRAAGSVQE